jgi:hypothetical protein
MPRTPKTEEDAEQTTSGPRHDARSPRAGGSAPRTPSTGTAARTAPREPRSASATATALPAGAPADERADAEPTREEIAARAFEIYQRRGGTDGQEIDDWVRAEQELREGRGRRQDET